MRNKITILLAILAISACSSTKEVAQEPVNAPVMTEVVQPAPVVEETPVVQEKAPEENIAIFSVPAAEMAASEIKPFVVYFDTNKFNIRDDAAATLSDKVLPEAKNERTKRIVIEAHCDERGSNAYNKKLSERRAASVKDFLVKNGIKSSNIKTVGYGENKPAAEGHSEEFWSQNRRAVTVVIKR